MPTPAKDYAKFISLLNSLVYQPSKRFFTDADYAEYVQAAALETALALGGLHFIDTTETTTASTRDIVLNNQIKKIKKAHYIKDFGLSTEATYPLEVITQPDQDFLGRLGVVGGPVSPDSPYLTSAATETPKFLIFWPEIETIRLIDTPSRTGDTLKLWCVGTPAAMGAGVTYDGDQMETMAIVYKMASLARMKSRETQEAGVFDKKFREQIESIIRMRSKMRQIRQAQDGRFKRTRLRSVNGAK